jgi:hypothetical protein
MPSTHPHTDTPTRILHWIARLTAIAAIIPILQIAFGEPGTGPSGLHEWLYLALFPFAFSAAYLLAWRYPLLGGTLSLACMALSLLVIGRTFGWTAYAFWAILCIPGILFVLAGLRSRKALALPAAPAPAP